MLVIVDYDLGNLGSIANMLRKLGHEAELTSDPTRIGDATRLILPGVGAFDQGMRNLRNRGLLEVLNYKVLTEQVPVLGICLGAQLMTRGSEEGESPGLGWIAARTVRFSLREVSGELKVPHMGWSDVSQQKPHPLFEGMYEEPRFYFVHSFHFDCEDAQDILTTTQYGYEFASSFARGNIWGVQFHPEKSHKFGLKLLDNFARVPDPAAIPVATSSV